MSTGPLITPSSSGSASAQAALAATRPPGPPPAQTVLPRWLVTAGAWSWRLIALGIVGYFLLKFILRIEVVVLPILAALVFTALLRPLMTFFESGRRDGGFDRGIEKALRALLVSPNFIFRVESGVNRLHAAGAARDYLHGRTVRRRPFVNGQPHWLTQRIHFMLQRNLLPNAANRN